MKTEYGKLTWEEVRDCDKDRVVILPVAATEDHGPHMVLDTDTLLGTSIQTLLEEMNLPPRVSEALLYGQGDFAPFLHLAQCCESFDPKALQAAVDQLHLGCEQVNRAQLVGLGFADSLHG